MIAVVASVVLGCTMCVAGASKVAMGRRWPMEATLLGAPRLVVPVLPWIEVLLGALLIAQWQRRPMAIAAGAMLVAFTALILANLARGRRPRCACFGSWSSRPLGWRHVARNAVLVALALLAIA